MSMQRLFTLNCDVCREDGPYGWYAEDVCNEAWAEGWVSRNGQDVCPSCAEGAFERAVASYRVQTLREVRDDLIALRDGDESVDLARIIKALGERGA